MMSAHATARGHARPALLDLLPALAELPEEKIVRPHTDPHAAAVTALLVADWLVQPERAARLQQIKVDADGARELARTARAIVEMIDELGGDYLSDARPISAELEARGQLVLTSAVKELAQALPDDREVRMWIEVVTMGAGPVDLVYDLRTLAELFTRHAARLSASLADLPSMLRTASDAIEYALRADEPTALALARGRLARLWTIFVPEYERLAAIARVLSREQGAEQTFPPLALVAARRRAQRRSRSTMPDPMEDEPRESGRDKAGRSKAATGSRRAHRAILEQEVGIESESNFYVGFTENLSRAGFFVATYLVKPIDAKVEMVLAMPDGDKLRIRGVVRWHRAATEDGWPGMGVQFEDLAPEQADRIRRFLALREPLFYAD